MSQGSVIPGELVDALYASALSPAQWPGSLSDCARYVAGNDSRALAALTFMRGEPPATGWLLTGVEGVAERAYRFADADSQHPLFVRAGALPESHVGPTEDFAAPDDLARTTLAREYFRDDGTIRGSSAVLHLGERLLAAVHVLRPRTAAAWPVGADERLRALRVPLRGAVEVYARLRAAREQAEIDREVLDLLDVATLLLDDQGRIVRANASALSLLERQEGLERAGDAVMATSPAANAALRRAVKEAVARRSAGGVAMSDVVMVPRRSGRRPLMVFVVGLPGGGAAMMARDPDTTGPHLDEWLQRLFGLTPTEARVSLRIAQGDAPEQVGEVLGISVETVRTHLKRVFDKTSTTRQSQVVRLVLGELPPVA